MTKTKLTKEEILNCLSDVIYFYSNEHKGGEGEDEEKEIAKNIEASEFIEDYFKKNYEKKEIIDNKVANELEQLKEMSDNKLIQHYKDYKWELENVLSHGKYEYWYLMMLEEELNNRDLI